MNRDKMTEYFKVTGIMNSVMQLVDTMRVQLMPMFRASVGPENEAELETMMQRYQGLLKVQVDALEEKFVNIYAEFLSEEDVEALLVFHNSPVSKKMREISPQLTERCMVASEEFNQNLLRQLSGLALA